MSSLFFIQGARIPFSTVATMYAYFFNFFVATTLWASYLTLAWDSLLFLFLAYLYPSFSLANLILNSLQIFFPLGTSTKIPYNPPNTFLKKPLNPFQNQTSYSLDECLLKETRKNQEKI